MPVYEYTALDAKGKTKTGIIDADSESIARQKIRSGGSYPTSVRPVKENASGKNKGGKGLSFTQRFTRISANEVAVMTRQLSTLIGAGFPLVGALDSLLVQISSPGLKKVIAGIKSIVVEGSSFSDAMRQYPNVFSPIYVNMVSSGETSGTLEIVLERLADITESQEALKSKMITAMIYPLVILAISVLIVSFLLVFVTPKIMKMFENMKQDLPLPTQILLGLSDIFKSYWWLLILGVIALSMGARAVYRNEKGRHLIDTKSLGLPLIGSLMRKLAIARFARTLGSLLDNGVSMLPALAIVQNIVGNVFIAEVVADGSQEVSKGKALGAALDVPKAFPPMAIQMIQVGEQSGNLEEMLNKVADVFEKEVETAAVRMTAMLEPIMVLIMACIVLFIVLAICLPIFEMNQLVK